MNIYWFPSFTVKLKKPKSTQFARDGKVRKCYTDFSTLNDKALEQFSDEMDLGYSPFLGWEGEMRDFVLHEHQYTFLKLRR